jgi:RNA polymerase sigma-70 factor (ECF subfamily)
VTQFPETRESLIVQVKNPGNRDAWGQFVDIYRPVIHRIAVARGMQDADAQDVTQQVLMRSPRRSGVGKRRARRLGFVIGCGESPGTRSSMRSLDVRRTRPRGRRRFRICWRNSRARRVSQDSATDSLIALEYRRELYLRAAAFVRTDVDTDTWRAFEMTVIEGSSNTDAAQELGKSIGTIYAARSRVMKRLARGVAEIEESQS